MCRILTASVLSLALIAATPAAWSAPRNDRNNELSTSGSTKKHLQIIVFAGVAGAILGLSTLSFYGRPQDKLNHIAIGAAVGIITGTVYSTFRVATEPREPYGLRANDGQFLAMAPTEHIKPELRPAGFSFSF